MLFYKNIYLFKLEISDFLAVYINLVNLLVFIALLVGFRPFCELSGSKECLENIDSMAMLNIARNARDS